MHEESSRVHALSVAESVPRQTPKNDFGEVLSRTISQVVNGGAALARGALGAVPMLSAAIAPGLQSVNGLVGSAASQTGASSAPIGSHTIEVALQRLEKGGELNNGDFLALQQAMQRENIQYTALSNILKVRADSAKSAINNIR